MSEIRVVTEMNTTEVTVRCPYCGEVQDGFVLNPAGDEFDCDNCGQTYKIHSEADIEFG